MSTPLNRSLVGADVHQGGVVVVHKGNVVGYQAVAVENVREVDLTLYGLSVAYVTGSLLGAEVKDAVAEGESLIAQQEGGVGSAAGALGKDKLQDEGAVDSIVVGNGNDRCFIDVSACAGLVECSVVGSTFSSVDVLVGNVVARPSVFLASHNDLCLVAGGTDKEVEGNHAVATVNVGDGGCQRTEGGRSVGLEQCVVSHIVAHKVELVETFAADNRSVIAVAVVDCQVEGVDARAAVGSGVSAVEDIAYRAGDGVAVVGPGVGVASGDGLAAVAVVVDSQVEGHDAVAQSHVLDSVDIAAGGSVGLTVNCPGVSVADGNGKGAVGAVTYSQVEGDGAVAAGEALVDNAVHSAFGVGHTILSPSVAVADISADAGVAGSADGQAEGIHAGAAVGGGVAVGVFTRGGIVGVVPSVAVAGNSSQSAAGVVVDSQVESVDARAVICSEIIAVVGAALGLGNGVAVVGPGVGVASRDSLAAVGVVVHRQLQGVGGSAVVRVNIFVDINTSRGVSLAIVVPSVGVASRFDDNIADGLEDGVAYDGVVALRVVVAVGVAESTFVNREAES